MEQVALGVTHRTETGKGAARRLRAAGSIPAVAYGLRRDPTPLHVDARTLEQLLSGHAGTNVLLNLEVEGATTDGDNIALLKSVQRHPVTDKIQSVDFQWVDVSQKLTVSVPVTIEGIPAGAELGGVIEYGLTEIQISCLPTDIPESIAVDVSHLGLAESVHVADIQLPEDVEVLSNPEDAIATCAVVRVVEEEPEVDEEAELEEGEEPPEGEEAVEAEGEEATEAEGEPEADAEQ